MRLLLTENGVEMEADVRDELARLQNFLTMTARNVGDEMVAGPAQDSATHLAGFIAVLDGCNENSTRARNKVEPSIKALRTG